MSEARTPEEDTIGPDEEHEAPSSDDDEYTGPDPEHDAKGDGSDEDQGT
jgi:hypothetical protein